MPPESKYSGLLNTSGIVVSPHFTSPSFKDHVVGGVSSEYDCKYVAVSDRLNVGNPSGVGSLTTVSPASPSVDVSPPLHPLKATTTPTDASHTRVFTASPS